MSNFQCRNGTQRYIYILRLEDGCYYVGETNNIERRYKQHCEGKHSAKWTSLHKPIEIIFTTEVKNDTDENNYTRLYMKKIKSGINKVRGGNYTMPVLKKRIYRGLKKRLTFIHEEMSIEEINGVFDEFKCAKYDTKIETVESKLLKSLKSKTTFSKVKESFKTQYVDETEEVDIINFSIKNLKIQENKLQEEEHKKEKKSRFV